jgi:hypothetical protein
LYLLFYCVDAFVVEFLHTLTFVSLSRVQIAFRIRSDAVRRKPGAGLTAAACLAKMGHDVTCLDVDLEKVAAVKANRLPISEPNLRPLWQRHQRGSTLRMTADYAKAVRPACSGVGHRRDATAA